jgi:hypothetical protein
MSRGGHASGFGIIAQHAIDRGPLQIPRRRDQAAVTSGWAEHIGGMPKCSPRSRRRGGDSSNTVDIALLQKQIDQ